MSSNRRCAALLAAITLPTVLALGVTAGAVSGASAAHLEVSAAPLQTWRITHGLPALPEVSQDPEAVVSTPSPEPVAPGHEQPGGTHESSGSASGGDSSGTRPPSTPATPAAPDSPAPAAPGATEPSAPPGPDDSVGSGVAGTGAGPDLGPDLSPVVVAGG